MQHTQYIQHALHIASVWGQADCLRFATELPMALEEIFALQKAHQLLQCCRTLPLLKLVFASLSELLSVLGYALCDVGVEQGGKRCRSTLCVG
jgi:hypothetical protein